MFDTTEILIDIYSFPNINDLCDKGNCKKKKSIEINAELLKMQHFKI